MNTHLACDFAHAGPQAIGPRLVFGGLERTISSYDGVDDAIALQCDVKCGAQVHDHAGEAGVLELLCDADRDAVGDVLQDGEHRDDAIGGAVRVPAGLGARRVEPAAYERSDVVDGAAPLDEEGARYRI